MDQNKLKEAEDFYRDRISGWMLNDLRKSIDVNTNFLTALACLIYTEIIGIFLPVIEGEKGSTEEKRFYRCLFRLNSNEYLRKLDISLRKISGNKGLYALRHSMAHKYYPTVSKRENKNYLCIASIIARDGVARNLSTNIKTDSPPIFLNGEKIVIATRNYVNELELSVKGLINQTFVEKDKEYQKAVIKGIDIIIRGGF